MEYIKQLNVELGNSIINIKIYNKQIERRVK